MSETQFTPGQWKWEDSELFSPEYGVCVLTCGTEKNGMPYTTATKADRALLASAPSLYEALEGILAWVRPIAGDNRDDAAAGKEIASVSKAEAALALARGEPK